MADDHEERVAFIGLGIMGSRMAANLVAGGVPLTVYNRSPGPREALVQQGAEAADSPAQAVQRAGVVFSMLSTPEVVAQLAFGSDGFLQEMPEGALWVDCSTVHPAFSRRSRDEAERLGLRFVDGPVSGTKPQAEAGDLLFYLGGRERDVDHIGFYLKMMGQKIIHVGEVGKGTSFKMLINSLLGLSMVAFSETVLLGERLGLSRDVLLDTLPDLAVTAPFLGAKAEKIKQGDYEVQFPLEWMHKDLELAARTASDRGQPFYLVNLAKELFAGAHQMGLAREDFSAIHQFLARE